MQSAQFQLHAQIEEQHWWFVARRQILQAVIHAVLPPSPETTIIDVGCGTGANLALLADQYRCIGIDTSLQAIELAKKRFPQVTFLRGRAPTSLGQAMSQAKLVMLNDVLEHVADDFSLLSELLAATQPGAYFLITVPADQSLWSEHDRAFGHYRRYDARRLGEVWQGLNVREVFLSPFNARLYPLVKVVRAWNRWKGQAAGEAGTDFKLPTTLANHLLARLFAGEQRRLVRLAKGEHLRPFAAGVSLMALLQRTAGPVTKRTKPASVAPDCYDPAQEQLVQA